MRLLDAKALIYDNVAELIEFPDESSAPPYAILSHTWEEEEVLFHDIYLGPQHEVQLSVASVRAMRRRHAMPNYNFDASSSEDAESEVAEVDSSDAGLSRLSSYSDKTTSATCLENSLIVEEQSDSKLLAPHIKAGWTKILNACLQTLRSGLTYIWVDTCKFKPSIQRQTPRLLYSTSVLGCIDKSSSAELSEAINSMYRWYSCAVKCYAYLCDCQWNPQSPEVETPLSLGWRTAIDRCIRGSRWFTRGWTLQELIAPKSMYFLDRGWQVIAERKHVPRILEDITGIQAEVFYWNKIQPMPPDAYSVAQRMFWASQRRTTRKEDEAYCLLGLFGITMPLLYGEGEQAFQRLQQEIIRTSTDQTIFAWDVVPSDENNEFVSLFALSPVNFGGTRDIVQMQTSGDDRNEGFRVTNEGLEIRVGLEANRMKYGCNTVIAILNCRNASSESRVGVWVRFQFPTTGEIDYNQWLLACFVAEETSKLGRTRVVEMSYHESYGDRFNYQLLIWHATRQVKILIRRVGPFPVKINIVSRGEPSKYHIMEGYPAHQWSRSGSSGNLSLPLGKKAFGAIAVQHQNHTDYFNLVFGVESPLNQTRSQINDSSECCRYWIFPWCKALPAPSGEQSPFYFGRVQKYLKLLCDRVAAFESKDFFENSTTRRDSSKTLRLSNGEDVSAASVGDGRSPHNHTFELKFERSSDSVNASFEEDHFSL